MGQNGQAGSWFRTFRSLLLLFLGSVGLAVFCVLAMGGPGVIAALFALIGFHYVTWGRALAESVARESRTYQDEDTLAGPKK